MKRTRFYAEIGKLLYAVSAIDHRIDQKEKLKMNEFMKRIIKQIDQKDLHGSSVAYYPEFEFEYLEEEIADPEDALQSFIDYVKEHYSAINKRDIEIIRSIVWETALAIRGINRSEKMVIDTMEHAFAYIKSKQINQFERHENHQKKT